MKIKNARFAKFTFDLNPLETIYLPEYKGSTFRGSFGNIFKKIACQVKNTHCSDCLLQRQCVYRYVFETPPPEGAEDSSRYSSAPHPYILEPPLEKKTEYHPGEIISFSLILVGKALEYLPYFIFTFMKAGQVGIGKDRGQYRLLKVTNKDKKGKDLLIYSPEDKILHDFNTKTEKEILRETRKLSGERVTLRFLTPLRLKNEGNLVKNIDFSSLIKSMLQRFSILSEYHWKTKQNWDYQKLLAESKEIDIYDNQLHWYDWERYSSRQDTIMNLGGFVGDITYAGDLSDFLLLLKLGEALHTGKGTSFGLGQYQIIKSDVKDN